MTKQEYVDKIVWPLLEKNEKVDAGQIALKHYAKLDSTYRSVYNKVKRSVRKYRGASVHNNNSKNKKVIVNKLSTPDALFMFSAVKDNGKIMSMEEYCEHYGLPLEDVASYKLVTSTSQAPYYNTQFKNKVVGEMFSPDEFRDIMSQYIEPRITTAPKLTKRTVGRIIYTDTHVGMEPNADGRSLYGGTWSVKDLYKSVEAIIDELVEMAAKGIEEVYIDDLGDYLDGMDGQTVRGGHALPQNLDNNGQFREGLSLKRFLMDAAAGLFKKVTFNNVWRDNHSGSFGYTVVEAMKDIAEIQYKNVKVINHETFISHYIVGRHVFLLCHGKDEKDMKFGMKVVPDAGIIKRLEEYLERHDLLGKGYSIEFSKGDSHQALVDFCSSNKIDYANYPALCPPSEYIKLNFGTGRRGFWVQTIDPDGKKMQSPVWL